MRSGCYNGFLWSIHCSIGTNRTRDCWSHSGFHSCPTMSQSSTKAPHDVPTNPTPPPLPTPAQPSPFPPGQMLWGGWAGVGPRLYDTSVLRLQLRNVCDLCFTASKCLINGFNALYFKNVEGHCRGMNHDPDFH